MPRNSVLGLLMLAVTIIAAYFLFPSSISSLCLSKYASISYGIVLATFDTIFSHGPSLRLLIWLIAGFGFGLMTHSSKRGFTIAFFASFFMFMVFYVAALVGGIAPSPHTMEGEFILISDFVFPFLGNLIFGGFGGFLGGLVWRFVPKKAPSELEVGMISGSLPMKCPHCGNSIYSNSKWCANCGQKLASSK